MGILGFIKRKKSRSSALDSQSELLAEKSQLSFAENDHLGMAAVACAKAKEAVSAGDFDMAWRLLHEQKRHYSNHAARSHFTIAQALALEASVHEAIANIHRIEGRHYDALINIIYWVSASLKSTKSQQQKLSAYFNRCKFKNLSLTELENLVKLSKPFPDFIYIRETVRIWRDYS